LAQTLSGRVGYQVNNGESSYAPGCTSNAQCVFPNAIIPQQAFGLPATKVLQFIPSPNVGSNQLSSGAEKQRTNDDKGSVRIDADTHEVRELLRLTQREDSGAYYLDAAAWAALGESRRAINNAIHIVLHAVIR
jgi:hypothetical protein